MQAAARFFADHRPALLVAVAVFAASLLLFTRNNTYAFYYHPDEPGKVKQVRKETRNFNHPQLLLNSASVVAKVLPVEKTSQTVVVIGRWISAIYVATAVALFSIVAACLAGPAVGLIAGLLIASTQFVAEAAHHFKEDSTFVFGFAAYALALVALDRRPCRTTVLSLGLALALISSAKYIGILAVLPGMVFLWWKVRTRAPGLPWSKGLCLGMAMGVFGFAMVVINYQVILGVGDFLTGLGSEIGKVQEQPVGITERIPNSYLWRAMLRETPTLTLLFAALGLLSPLLERRRPLALEIALVALPLLYWIATCFSGKVAMRYFDPLAAMLAFVAAIGLGRSARVIALRLVKPGLRQPAEYLLVTLGAGGMLLANFPSLALLNQDFQTDTRRDLASFIMKNLPATAIIAQDKQVKLPNDSRPEENVDQLVFKQKILPPSKLGPVADLGSLDALRAAGVTHIAVAQSDWGAFFSSQKYTTGWSAPDTARRAAFYQQLFDEGTRVWEASAGKTDYVRQGLILFDVRKKPQ